MLLPAVPYIFHRKKIKRNFSILQRLSEYEGEYGQQRRHTWPFFLGNLQEVKPQMSGHREVIVLSTTLSEGLQWICKIPV